MTTFNYEDYTLPTHFASYLINSDCSGLEEAEIKAIDKWIEEKLKEHKTMECFDVSEESEFKTSNDLNNLGGEVSVFSFDVGSWAYNNEKELREGFKEISQHIPKDDIPMLNEEFSNWKDRLQKDGEISESLCNDACLSD